VTPGGDTKAVSNHAKFEEQEVDPRIHTRGRFPRTRFGGCDLKSPALGWGGSPESLVRHLHAGYNCEGGYWELADGRSGHAGEGVRPCLGSIWSGGVLGEC